jgi:hypothetical protein
MCISGAELAETLALDCKVIATNHLPTDPRSCENHYINQQPAASNSQNMKYDALILERALFIRPRTPSIISRISARHLFTLRSQERRRLLFVPARAREHITKAFPFRASPPAW